MVELDRKGKLVLEAIYELGGEANTSEIKEYTGIEKNGIIRYRYEKLEEEGLAETRTVDADGVLPITVAELTEEGEEFAVGSLEESAEPTLAERVEQLRDVVGETHSKVERFEGRVDAVEENAEGAVEDAEEATERTEGFEERVEQLEADVSELETQVHSFERTANDLEKTVESLKPLLRLMEGNYLFWEDRGEDGEVTWRKGPLLEFLEKSYDEANEQSIAEYEKHGLDPDSFLDTGGR